MLNPESVLKRLREASEGVLTGSESLFPLASATFGGAASEDEIAELNEVFGPLPDDYVAFVRSCRRIVAMDYFSGYVLHSPMSLTTEIHHIHLNGGTREVRVVGVGSDGGGNTFLMGLAAHPNAAASDDLGRIWRHNHSRSYRADGVATEGLIKIADSFLEFFNRMAEDWEHFAAKDSEWQYISG
jgi:hypothetical protein